MIEVRSWGIAGAVVDGGRPGRGWLGAGRGGAVDLPSLHLANRIVGNAPSASALESSGGLTFAVVASALVAVTGAVADVTVSRGSPLGWGAAALLPAGAEVRLGRLHDGARVYVAVRGGVRGDAHATQDPLVHPVPRVPHPTTVRVWPGPRLDWFAAGTWAGLDGAQFTVTSTSRVGARLAGPAIVRTRSGELPSEGMVEGAVQVPPDGSPIIMLADHPATGGYPVVAVVDPEDIPIVAQAAAGTPLTFRVLTRTPGSE